MTDRPTHATWETSWLPDPGSIAAMSSLAPGTNLVIVKRGPDGDEVTRYPATVVESKAPAPWIEVVATWTLHRVEVAGLAFDTSDTIREFFSAKHPFNAFAVVSPEGEFRGWYGNVTYPAFVLPKTEPLALVWHDLYLDVVILPDGSAHLLDDEEFEDSGLPATQSGFAKAIIQARHDLIEAIPTLIP